MTRIAHICPMLLVLLALSPAARADNVVVVVENTMNLDSFFLTPVWVAAHDGSFDVWSSGQFADDFPGLELLAEDGDTSAIDGSFMTSPAGSAGGQSATITADTIPAPVYSPGESSTYVFDIGDPTVNRFFSYASMVIPSNDLFIATSVPTTHEMFDASGEFLGPFTIEIFGSAVVDAGTEVNNIEGGAAFSALGGSPVDESNLLADIFDLDPMGNYLSSIVGSETVTGSTIGSTFSQAMLIARITVKIPSEPMIRVTVENVAQDDGFFFTPFWVAAHNGQFDVWSAGQMAGDFPGLEELAEGGDTVPISDAFSASMAGTAGGSQATIAASDTPPPVFSPGESAMFVLPVGESSINRYFSYASMVIPSNDLFVATSVPTTHELFDTNGEFLGPITIEIFGSDVVDAGTEVNDITGGAAFSALGGTAVDEANPLADLYDIDPAADFLSSVIGTETASGATVGSIFAAGELIARITIDLEQGVPFIRGDVDASGAMQVTDGVRILETLFSGGIAFDCERAADVNDSNVVDLADAVILLTYLFLEGSPPPAPFPSCGFDMTPDLLSCGAFDACP